MEDIGSRLGSSIENRVRGARARRSLSQSIQYGDTKNMAQREYQKGVRAGELKAALILGPLFALAGALIMLAIIKL